MTSHNSNVAAYFYCEFAITGIEKAVCDREKEVQSSSSQQRAESKTK